MPTAPPVSDLSDHLGYWLRAVSNHVSHAFARRLAAKGVTVAEWAVMRTLHGREPMPPSRLAERMGLSRGAVTKLADRLIGKALLARTPDAEDGRMHALALTPEGAALVPELARLADRNDGEAFAALSAAERGSLEQMLKRLAAAARITAVPLD
ncbi:MAG TPA: MarR family transcriptional regulator [Xanthobacteraceae bacterium]|nr:MarR family transcriptional regulator [Xanthobacteraceae bacterium]